MTQRLLLILGLVTACAPTPPTTVATPRVGTTVQASFGRTWNAVIDQFADRNIPIRTIDRSSGLIATDMLGMGVGDSLASTWADCGADMVGSQLPPGHATYNVLVRGDSTSTLVKVTVRWNLLLGGECVTHGVWEQDFENAVKAKAEKP